MNTEKWSWMMEYCKKKRIPPAETWAWREAEKAYLKELKAKNKKLKIGIASLTT